MLDVIWDPTSCHEDKAILGEEMASYQRSMLGSGHGFWEWDLNANKMRWYGIFWRELGYDELDTRSMTAPEVLLDYIHPDDRIGFRDAIRDTIKYGAQLDYCYRLQSKRGHYLWVRVTGQGYRDESGWTHYVAGTNQDISELKNTQSALEEAKAVAERANQAKSDFLSSMSHELRTPLNAILGFTHLVARDRSTSVEHRENLEEVDKAGRHLLGLINEILDLAKIESGQMSLSLETLAARAVVSECVRLMEPMAQDHGVSIRCHFGQAGRCLVSADHTRLKQVVLNLLSNAIKYNHSGGRVDLALEVPNDQWLRLRISDTGLGIPRAKLSQVFEPFMRLHDMHPTTEGTGVGLVITKRLVELMNGQLDFISTEGEGSSFWVDLPQAVTRAPSPARCAPVSVSETPPTLAIAGQRRILYVEDNPANAKLLVKLLRLYPQLDLTVTAEPMVGIYQARTQQPDLILLDIGLPDLDGFELLRILKEDESTRHIPVVALSANARRYEIDRSREAGFLHYLTKPLELDRLIRVLNDLWPASHAAPAGQALTPSAP